MGLLRSGFVLEAVEEAKPSAEMLDISGMRDELRRPMMLLVRARAAHDGVGPDFFPNCHILESTRTDSHAKVCIVKRRYRLFLWRNIV